MARLKCGFALMCIFQMTLGRGKELTSLPWLFPEGSAALEFLPL
jgi:hypothetical protein